MAEATLITGCSSGIGRALAGEFARRGHVVYATARRLEALEGLETHTAALDVNDAASIAAPFGIHVVTVQPGSIQAEFGATAGAGAAARRESLSLYAPVAEAIAARAGASQESPTPAAIFARKLADAVLAEKPSAVSASASAAR